jgi:hypothetical protein
MNVSACLRHSMSLSRGRAFCLPVYKASRNKAGTVIESERVALGIPPHCVAVRVWAPLARDDKRDHA